MRSSLLLAVLSADYNLIYKYITLQVTSPSLTYVRFIDEITNICLLVNKYSLLLDAITLKNTNNISHACNMKVEYKFITVLESSG